MAEATVGLLRVVLSSNSAQFDAGMDKSSGKVEAFGQAGKRAAANLSKLVTDFNGSRVTAEATRMAAAVEKVGGASKLTEAELARVNRTLDASIAKFKSLGQDVPPQIAKLKAEVAGLDKASSTAATGGLGKFSGALGVVGKLLPALGLASAVAGLVRMGSAALDAADKHVTYADKLGVSTETTQRWAYVAGQTGTTMEAFGDSAFKLGINLSNGTDKVRKAVGDLRLAYVDLKNLKPEQQFDVVVKALEGVESATERNRIGQALFGKQFSEIAAAVAGGYTEISRSARVNTDEQIRALEQLGDKWQELKGIIAVSISGAMANMASDFTAAAASVDSLSESERAAWVVANKLGDGHRYLIDLQAQRMAAMKETVKLQAHAAKATTDETAATTDYVAKLAEFRAEVSGLTADQKKQIDAAAKLGQVNDEFADGLGVSIEAIRLYQGQVKDGAKGTSEFAASALKAAAAVEKFWEQSDRLGKDGIHNLIFELGKWETIATDHFTLVDMTAEGYAKATAEAQAWALKNGAVLAPSIKAVGAASVVAGEQSQSAFSGLLPVMDQIATAINGTFAQMMLGAKSFSEGMGDIWDSLKAGAMRAFTQILSDFAGRFLKGMVGMMRGQQGAMGQAFAGMMGGGGAAGGMSSISQAGFGLGSSGAGAAGGAGTGAGAAAAGVGSAALAGFAMGQWGKQIFGGAGVKAGAFGAAGGAAAGAAIGSVIPVLGTAVGAIVGGLAGMAAGFIGISKQVKDTRKGVEEFQTKIRATLTDQQKAEAGGEKWKETVIGVRDAYLATGRTAEDAEAAVNAMWDTGHPERALAAVQDINKAMEEYAIHLQRVERASGVFDEIMAAGSEGIPASFQPSIDQLIALGLLTDEQIAKLKGLKVEGVDTNKMEAGMALFKGRREILGPQYEQAKVNETAQSYIQAIDDMTKGGASLDQVLHDAQEEISALVKEALKSGSTLPANMQPWIESLMAQGKLLDENGTKITDVSQLKFGEAVKTESEKAKEGWDAILSKIQDLIDKIAGPLEGAIDRVTRDRNVTIEVDYQERNRGPREDDREGFASGTMGRLGQWFGKFGPGTTTRLHGAEAVVTPRQAVPFARDVLASAFSGPQAALGRDGAILAGDSTSMSTSSINVLPVLMGSGMSPRDIGKQAAAYMASAGLANDEGGITSAFESVIDNWMRTYARG